MLRRFFQDPSGKPSMMRLLAFLGALAGTALVVTGIVGFLRGTDGAATMATIGAGLFSMGEVLKGIQKRMEP